MYKRLLFIIIGLSLVSGCGLKLRGSFDMSAALTQISIEGGERQLRDRLMAVLVKSGSTVVDESVDSPTLVLANVAFNRDIRTQNADGIATGYNYLYLVDYSVTDTTGAILLPRSSTSQFRTAEYEAGDELEIEEEEAFLKGEMENEIVLQIMRKLARI